MAGPASSSAVEAQTGTGTRCSPLLEDMTSRRKPGNRFKMIRGAVLAAMLALALPGPARSATFGADVAGMFPPAGGPVAGAVSELQALRAVGATVARSDSFWEIAEPQPPVNGAHTYDWAYDDEVMSTFAQAGLRWQPIIDYAPTWAANSTTSMHAGVSPAHLSDYAAYAAAFAARYGTGGAFWAQHPSLPPDPVTLFEIWNEPDLGFFWAPQPDLAEYATLFLDARTAIRAVEPGTKVIIGGLIDPAYSLPAMLAARPDLRMHVDGIGVHTYDPTASLTLASVANDLNVDAATLDVPLYVNEWGWQSIAWGWQAATEAVRDAEIRQVTEQLGQDPSVADVEPYCWGCSDAFNIYGTPAATAFQQGIAAARSAIASATTTVPSALGVNFTARPSRTKGKHRTRHRHRHRPRHRHRHRPRRRHRHRSRSAQSGTPSPRR
jgi:hypothetical protein